MQSSISFIQVKTTYIETYKYSHLSFEKIKNFSKYMRIRYALKDVYVPEQTEYSQRKSIKMQVMY